jgi:hypothetical protein
MNIIAIEMRREQLKLPRARLCRYAKVNVSTYGRLMARPGSGQVSTLSRLQTALAAYELLQRASNPTDNDAERSQHAA